MEIDLGQDVAESVIRQSEEQVMLTPHLPFQVEADIGKCLAGNRQNLSVSDIDEVDLCGDAVIRIVRILER